MVDLITGFDALSAEPFDEPAARDSAPCLYDRRAEQLESLHRPPAVEHRPPEDTVFSWTNAKREALSLARLFRTIPTLEAADHAQALRGCQSSFYMAPTSDGWTIPRSRSSLRRCHRRLCPVDSLAARRKQRRAIDQCADRLSAEGWHLTFATLSAPRLSIAEFWTAWRKVNRGREFKRTVHGAFVSVHLSRGLNVHAHALLATAEQLDPDVLRLWWFRVCHADLDRPGNTWAELCTNPAAAIQYAARPARALLLDDPARLPELFALVKGARLHVKTGVVLDYWDDTTERGEIIGPAVRYGWTWDDDDAESGAYDLAPL